MKSPKLNLRTVFITLLFLLLPTVIRARQTSSSEPEARNKAAIAYDSQRDKLVLFGGAVGLGRARRVTGDTWEWDGKTWTRVSESGPPPRAAHAMTYDSQRKKIVLFGGDGAAGTLGDTWEWDGKTWTQVATTGPAARGAHRIAYDSRRKKVVLFSGTSQFGRAMKPAFNDTWEWDGRAWKLVSSTGPAGRLLFGLAYDVKRSKVVLFGGNTSFAPPFEAGLRDDTWEWDGQRWSEIKASGPAKRDHNNLIYDAARGQTILYGGGANGVLLGDTWAFDGRQWTKLATTAPTTLGADAIAFDTKRKTIVVYGGWAMTGQIGPLPDLWEFDGQQWSRLK